MLALKGQGKEAKLSYHGHLMTENRNGLVMNTRVTRPTVRPSLMPASDRAPVKILEANVPSDLRGPWLRTLSP